MTIPRKKPDCHPHYVGAWDSHCFQELFPEGNRQLWTPESKIRPHQFRLWITRQDQGFFDALIQDSYGWAQARGMTDFVEFNFVKAYSNNAIRHGGRSNPIRYCGKKIRFTPESIDSPRELSREYIAGIVDLGRNSIPLNFIMVGHANGDF